jgi:hypothetical protein
MQGYVKDRRAPSFGFIRLTAEFSRWTRDFYFRSSSIEGEQPMPGDLVEFLQGDDNPDGGCPIAVNVRLAKRRADHWSRRLSATTNSLEVGGAA